MSFTPGPWELGYGATAVPTQLKNSSKTFVLQSAQDGGPGEMAFISSWINDPSDAKEAEANARLIAAAPELLEALELVQDCLVKALTGGEVSAKLAGMSIEKAALVIAKARGEGGLRCAKL